MFKMTELLTNHVIVILFLKRKKKFGIIITHEWGLQPRFQPALSHHGLSLTVRHHIKNFSEAFILITAFFKDSNKQLRQVLKRTSLLLSGLNQKLRVQCHWFWVHGKSWTCSHQNWFYSSCHHVCLSLVSKCQFCKNYKCYLFFFFLYIYMQEWKCVSRKWNVYVLETDSNVSISHTVHFLLNLSVAFNPIIPVSVKLTD